MLQVQLLELARQLRTTVPPLLYGAVGHVQGLQGGGQQVHMAQQAIK
jgi:hypothetical protein